MGDTDTKQEAQAQAKLRATTAALDEAGTYVEHILTGLSSERNGRFRGEYTESITAITAGVVRILDEDVRYTSTFHAQSGNVTWVCRLKAHIDEKEVLERVRRIRDNRQILAGLEEVQAENARQLRELDRLRDENERLRIHLSSTASRADRNGSEPAQHLAAVGRERQQAVKRLRAVEHFQSGLYAQAGGNERAARQEYAQAVDMGYDAPRAYVKTLGALGLGPAYSVRGYKDLLSVGVTYAGGEKYLNGTFGQGGFLFYHPVGLEGALCHFLIRLGRDTDSDDGLLLMFPVGLFVSIIESDYALLSASAQAFVYNRVSHDDPRKSETDYRSFPPFADVALEWRSFLHSVRAGYRLQAGADKGGSVWPSGLDLTGAYLELHVGLSAVVPAKR